MKLEVETQVSTPLGDCTGRSGDWLVNIQGVPTILTDQEFHNRYVTQSELTEMYSNAQHKVRSSLYALVTELLKTGPKAYGELCSAFPKVNKRTLANALSKGKRLKMWQHRQGCWRLPNGKDCQPGVRRGAAVQPAPGQGEVRAPVP